MAPTLRLCPRLRFERWAPAWGTEVLPAPAGATARGAASAEGAASAGGGRAGAGELGSAARVEPGAHAVRAHPLHPNRTALITEEVPPADALRGERSSRS